MSLANIVVSDVAMQVSSGMDATESGPNLLAQIAGDLLVFWYRVANWFQSEGKIEVLAYYLVLIGR
jgi:hypothetical protein